MCFQIVFEFCSLQVASQPGDCKCVFTLSSNSVTLNLVRFKLPANWESDSVFKLSSNSVTLNLVRFKLPANRESDSVFSSCLRTQ